eukprot:Plantae.Rhodophyta-Purpureofilum_apyrenoidigerum.ctg7798.p1 GENE.Plantae.Rhodophyta-Purpureofilum_apyrenoidigerum.ctg7798~~Plantae.Rhodophyta-Purpureofilum_apyrenoidigerum.ctg7798.p1  ORF type:complete len:210 (-),score=44.67 Plantae.Rhodophyta-Purpureofilum_apyrenoidigerum.ctg7798:205-834(-)
MKGTQPFFDFLVEDQAMSKMEIAEKTLDTDGNCYLKCVYIPKTVAIPDILRGILGETILEVIDEQSWSPEEPYKINYKVTPCFLSDQIKTSGFVEIIEHEDPNKCVQVVNGTTNVSIYFIGGYIEEALLDNLKKFYAAYPTHMARFRTHIEDTVEQDACFLDNVETYLTRCEGKSVPGDDSDRTILAESHFKDRATLLRADESTVTAAE